MKLCILGTFLVIFLLLDAFQCHPKAISITEEDLQKDILFAARNKNLDSLVRRKRFILPGVTPNLLNILLFPTPILPTNFIGLQVTLPAPKKRT